MIVVAFKDEGLGFAPMTKFKSTTMLCGHDLGVCTPSYILHTRAFGTYLLGVYLP